MKTAFQKYGVYIVLFSAVTVATARAEADSNTYTDQLAGQTPGTDATSPTEPTATTTVSNTVSLSKGQMHNGKVVICAAAANAAYENATYANNLLESCTLAMKASSHANAMKSANFANGVTAVNDGGTTDTKTSLSDGKAKKIFKVFEKNFSVKRGAFSKSMRGGSAMSNFSDMLKKKLPSNVFADAAAAMEKASAAAEAEANARAEKFEVNAGIAINKHNKSLRDTLKEQIAKSSGQAKAVERAAPVRRVASAPKVFTPTDLNEVQLSAEELALFTQPAPEASPDLGTTELSIFDVVRRKYKEKYGMMDPKSFGLSGKAQP